MKGYERLVAIHQITEWKDGCIYKTKFIEEKWLPAEIEVYSIIDGDKQICNLSSKRMKELNYETFRKITQK